MKSVVKTAHNMIFLGHIEIKYKSGEKGKFVKFTNGKKVKKTVNGKSKMIYQEFLFESSNLDVDEFTVLEKMSEFEIKYIGDLEEGINFITFSIKKEKQTSLEEFEA